MKKAARLDERLGSFYILAFFEYTAVKPLLYTLLFDEPVFSKHREIQLLTCI
jgi:hypothetical protein